MNLNNIIANENSTLSSVVLHWLPSMHLADEQFFDFCQLNKELRIERTASGDCEIMVPTGGETSWRNLKIAAQLYLWAEQDGNGVAFDSSGGFTLPNGAMRSPDVSWVKKSRLAILTAEQKQRFLPLCPDFVIELRSPSDSLKTLHNKMEEYIENGATLGWLINPEKQQVYTYRVGEAMFCLESPKVISAGDVLKGFELDMEKIWSVEF